MRFVELAKRHSAYETVVYTNHIIMHDVFILHRRNQSAASLQQRSIC